MADISVPHGLTQATAILDFADNLKKLLDPSERKKIADDIVQFQALNDTEAKKASDARLLMKQHQDVLDEMKKENDRIAAERKALKKEKDDFDEFRQKELAKIAEERSLAENDKTNLVAGLAQRDTIDRELRLREIELNKKEKEVDLATKKLAEDTLALDKSRKEIESHKASVQELDQRINEKLEAVKKFNL